MFFRYINEKGQRVNIAICYLLMLPEGFQMASLIKVGVYRGCNLVCLSYERLFHLEDIFVVSRKEWWSEMFIFHECFDGYMIG